MITYKGRQVPETFEEILNPAHTALIIHEMRNDLRETGTHDKDGKPIIIDMSTIAGPISKLIEAARRNKMKIIYAGYVGHSDESLYSDYMIQKSYKRLTDPKTAPPGLDATQKSRAFQVIDELKPQPGDTMLMKPRVDCFIGTDLELMLRWGGIKTIVIAGVGSEIGIVPTVFHAINLGFFVVVPSDGVRPTHTDWHEDALKFISHNCHGNVAEVRPSSDILKVWKKK